MLHNTFQCYNTFSQRQSASFYRTCGLTYWADDIFKDSGLTRDSACLTMIYVLFTSYVVYGTEYADVLITVLVIIVFLRAIALY